jgi:thymidylate kinase
MIIEGVGGAGKTSACAIQIVEDIPESEIWTAAPTDI